MTKWKANRLAEIDKYLPGWLEWPPHDEKECAFVPQVLNHDYGNNIFCVTINKLDNQWKLWCRKNGPGSDWRSMKRERHDLETIVSEIVALKLEHGI